MESNGRVAVLTGILLVARGGATKTEIIGESSLTQSQVEQCLCFLQQSDLLHEDGKQVFKPTRKGESLIEDYMRIDQAIEGRLVPHLTV